MCQSFRSAARFRPLLRWQVPCSALTLGMRLGLLLRWACSSIGRRALRFPPSKNHHLCRIRFGARARCWRMRSFYRASRCRRAKPRRELKERQRILCVFQYVFSLNCPFCFYIIGSFYGVVEPCRELLPLSFSLADQLGTRKFEQRLSKDSFGKALDRPLKLENTPFESALKLRKP